MAVKPWNPLRLDLPAFAREAASLAGQWPAQDLTRFAHGAPDRPAERWAAVVWTLRGQERPVAGGEPEVWLHLEVKAEAWLSCQRCLKPVALPLEIDRAFRFVRNESEAAELDADSDDDVLVLSRAFDVREWVEDELLLALPIVPMHEVCPEPLLVANDELPAESAEASERPHPFAALASLRGKVDEPKGGS